MEDYQFTTLTEDEMNRVNGAWLANAAGAIAGGVGGFFGAIISGGARRNSRRFSHWRIFWIYRWWIKPCKGFRKLGDNAGRYNRRIRCV